MSTKAVITKERNTLRRRMIRTLNNLTDLSLETQDELRTELEFLEMMYTDIRDLDQKLIDMVKHDVSSSEDDLYELEVECDDLYKQLMQTKNSLVRTLDSVVPKLEPNDDNSRGNSKILLPKLKLPEFSGKFENDGMTCSMFMDTFESLIASYKLNDVEKFNVLENQCSGRAQAMILSLSVSNQTYTKAKAILMDAFADDVTQKYFLINKLRQLDLGKNGDPFLYFAEFSKICDAMISMKIDMKTIFTYYIWNGLNTDFQNILVNLTNSSYPKYDEITSKFFEAANRYNINISKYNSVNMATSLEVDRETTYNCVLCNSSNHNISKCDKYVTAIKKLDRAKYIKLCLKCLKPACKAIKCTFKISGNCHKCKQKHWSFLCDSNNVNIKPVKINMQNKGETSTSVVTTSSVIGTD